MTRIIAGSARGRRLAVPPGRATRPTAERAREGLFSTFDAVLGNLAGLRFLDLYAGSGAVGLEALSRGAAHALLVESSAGTARVISTNLSLLGLVGGEVEVVPVEQLLARASVRAAYDVVFADPPYAMADDDLRRVLTAAEELGWLAPGAVVAVERATRGGDWQWPGKIIGDRCRRYGEATLWYGRAAGRSARGSAATPT